MVRDAAHTLAVVHTSQGDFTIRFFDDRAPNHVKNFLELAASGFYDGTLFHRVIRDFIIQGGDPLTKDPKNAFLWGNAGRTDAKGNPITLKPEFNDTSHRRGIVSMARSSAPDSASSQFFIVLKDYPSLDHQYTAFGEVVKGMDVVDRLAAVSDPDPSNPTLGKPRNPQNAPLDRARGGAARAGAPDPGCASEIVTGPSPESEATRLACARERFGVAGGRRPSRSRATSARAGISASTFPAAAASSSSSIRSPAPPPRRTGPRSATRSRARECGSPQWRATRRTSARPSSRTSATATSRWTSPTHRARPPASPRRGRGAPVDDPDDRAGGRLPQSPLRRRLLRDRARAHAPLGPRAGRAGTAGSRPRRPVGPARASPRRGGGRSGGHGQPGAHAPRLPREQPHAHRRRAARADRLSGPAPRAARLRRRLAPVRARRRGGRDRRGRLRGSRSSSRGRGRSSERSRRCS